MPEPFETDLERTEAARDWGTQLVGEAKRLAIKFEFLYASDSAAFRDALLRFEEIVAKLRAQTIGSTAFQEPAPGKVHTEPSSESGDVEGFILQVIGIYPEGASVADIFAGIVDMGREMSREALTVRLHRMVRAGKVVRKSQGHYVLAPHVGGLRVIAG